MKRCSYWWTLQASTSSGPCDNEKGMARRCSMGDSKIAPCRERRGLQGQTKFATDCLQEMTDRLKINNKK